MNLMKIFALNALTLMLLFFAGSSSVLANNTSPFETEEYKANWGLQSIKAASAYAAGWSGAGKLIGIIDDGFDITHPEYSSKVIEMGMPFYQGVAHGTHVTGIAAARKNESGMHGVAYDARLVLHHYGDLEKTKASFDAVSRLKPAAINNSWGYDINIQDILSDPLYKSGEGSIFGALSRSFGGGNTEEEWRGFIESLQRAQEHSVIVFAASNDPELGDIDVTAGMPLLFPEFQAWLAVVNVNQHMELRSIHCGSAGPFCLAAPGEDIYSTLPGNKYDSDNGTSMAAPHVSGALAIAAQMYPGASPSELASLVLTTSTDIGDQGIDDQFGWGFLNLHNLVQTSHRSGRAVFANAATGRLQLMRFMDFLLTSHVMEGSPKRTCSLDSVMNIGTVPLASFSRFSSELETGNRDRLAPLSSAVWTRGFYGESKIPSTNDVSGAFIQSQGGVFGIDLVSTDAVLAGLGLGASRTRLTMPGEDEGEADGIHGLAYLGLTRGPWFTSILGTVSHFDQSHERVTVPGLQDTVIGTQEVVGSSETHATGQSLSLRSGYSFTPDPVVIEPYLKAAFYHEHLAGTEEDGVPLLNYTLQDTTRSQFQYGGGLRIARAFAFEKAVIRTGLDTGYAHFSGDTDGQVKTRLLGTPFTARTAGTDRDALEIGAELGIDFLEGLVKGDLRYTGEFRRITNHLFQAGLSLHF